MKNLFEFVPFSKVDDEDRFFEILTELIEKGELEKFRGFKRLTEAEKKRLLAKEKREAKAADKWKQENKEKFDEFEGKNPMKNKAADGVDDDLVRAIQAKRNKLDHLADQLEAKYVKPKTTRQKKK
jgi:hypothetical protein